MLERTILLIDMDAFFASCEQAMNPSLQGKPIIVCGNPKTRSVVAACSYEAKARGVGNGMSIQQARSLCPNVILVAGQPDLYVDLAHRIFGSLSRYTPMREVVSIDEAFLDVTDTTSRFGGAEQIAHNIQAQVQKNYHLPCTIGIGPNKLLAKLMAQESKPRGIGRITPNQLPEILAPLPVETVCGIGPRMTEHLLGMGVRTLGELAKVPTGELKARFGLYGEALHQMALGVDESPVLVEDHPDVIQSMGHMYTLDQNTTDPRILRGTLLRLSEKVGRRLREAGLAARTVCATVRFGDFTGRSRQHTGEAFLNQGLAIYRVAWQLFRQMGVGGRGLKAVRLVGVSVAKLSRSQPTPDFWTHSVRQDQLSHSLDQINDLYGEETIHPAGTMVPFIRKTKGYFGPRWV